MDSKEKSFLPINKQLTSYRTKCQVKVTILGTDRTKFACALTMALRQHLACAFQLCPISRSVNLIYTSDIAYTSRSDVILITEMHNSDARTKQHNKRSSLSLKQQAEQFIDRLRGDPSTSSHDQS